MAGGKSANVKIRFWNNLFVTDGVAPLLEVEKNQRDVRFQGNAYWTASGKFLASDRGKTYTSFETWRAAAQQETLNGVKLGVFADPRFAALRALGTLGGEITAEILQEFRLLPDSPLVDAGLDLGAQFGVDPGKQDLWGTAIPQGTRFDIGANELPR